MKRMRSRQRIHGIQNTATSMEEFRTLVFESICIGNINQGKHDSKDKVFGTVNIDIIGREN